MFKFNPNLALKILAFFITWLIFIINIWIINRGSGFTVPREMLFRNYADLKTPIIAFPFILALLWLGVKYCLPKFQKLRVKTKTALVFLFSLLSSFSLFFTVQTNPDMGRYQVEAKYLAENGILTFFKNWGSFYCPIDFPVIPFIYGISFKLLGDGEPAVLLVNLLLFAGLLIFMGQIAQRIFGKRVALLAVILLSTTPFIITQTHLFLVDIGQTFFLILSAYLLFISFEKHSNILNILTSFSLFLATFTKGHAVLFLIPLFIFSIIRVLTTNNNSKLFKKLLFIWGKFFLLSTITIYLKKEWFLNWIINALSVKDFIASLLPVFIIGLILIVLARFFLKNKRTVLAWISNHAKGLLLLYYIFLALLSIFGGKKAFYLRTPMPAMNIIVTSLFYLSPIFIIYKKLYLEGVLLLFWAFMPLFIPNTMFKYQLPSYPAIMMLAAFSLTSLAKKVKKQAFALTAILALSFSITYFFFLPMINTHVKNNFRNAVAYADKFRPAKIVLLFAPIGDYGQTLLKSLDKNLCSSPPSVLDLCPAPPSLVDIMDYYSKSEVVYLSNYEFLQALASGQAPEMVFLALHMDVPTTLDPQLEKVLLENYRVGPLFDQAKGSGIWRVKIQTFSRP